MAQYARPDSDITVANWAPVPSSPTTRYDKVDEVSPADGDYVENTANTFYDIELGLSDVNDPLSSSNHTIRIRNQKTAGGGAGTAYLFEGSTQRATFSLTADTGWTTDSYTLTAGEADSIGDYTNLRLRINARRFRFSWEEFEVPDAAQQYFQTSDIGVTAAASQGAKKTKKTSGVGVTVATSLGAFTINKIASLAVSAATSLGAFNIKKIANLAVNIATTTTKKAKKIIALAVTVATTASASKMTYQVCNLTITVATSIGAFTIKKIANLGVTVTAGIGSFVTHKIANLGVAIATTASTITTFKKTVNLAVSVTTGLGAFTIHKIANLSVTATTSAVRKAKKVITLSIGIATGTVKMVGKQIALAVSVITTATAIKGVGGIVYYQVCNLAVSVAATVSSIYRAATPFFIKFFRTREK